MNRTPHTIERPLAAMVWLLASLLLVVPVGHHAVDGILLCFGADGHVELEGGRWSDCATTTDADPHVAERTVQTEATDDCGPCIDVPLMANPTEGRAAIVESAPFVPDASLVAVVGLGVAPSAERAPPALSGLRPDVPLPSSPVGLRTIVLRV